MSYMFLNYRMCGEDHGNLLDLSNWDTSNVRNFQGMFSGFNGYKLLGGGCYGVNVKFPEATGTEAGGLKTGAQANISYMFENSKIYTNLNPIVPEEGETLLFKYESPTIKLSDIIQTKDVANFSHLFDGAYSGEIEGKPEEGTPYWYESVTIDVSDIDYSNATDMSYMFANAFTKSIFGGDGATNQLTGRLNLFKNAGKEIEQTINGEHFFDGCNVKEIDLTNFNTGLFNNLSYFFANYGYRECLGVIKSLNLFDMSNAKAVAGLFYNSYFTTEDGEPLVLD